MAIAQLRFQKYFNWFLINFVFSLLPIAITWLVAGELADSAFLSLIAFVYTLMISSLYLFKKLNKATDSSKEYITWVVVLLLIIFYVLYPHLLSGNILKTIISLKTEITLSILVGAMILSFILNFKSLEDDIDNAQRKKPFEQAIEIRKKFSKMEEDLKR